MSKRKVGSFAAEIEYCGIGKAKFLASSIILVLQYLVLYSSLESARLWHEEFLKICLTEFTIPCLTLLV